MGEKPDPYRSGGKGPARFGPFPAVRSHGKLARGLERLNRILCSIRRNLGWRGGEPHDSFLYVRIHT
ncbi:unnamed protein product [Calypogeia fissa]